MGPNLNPGVIQQTNELYAPLLAQAPKDGVKVTKDEAYGPHARHRLDVYAPENTSAGPVPMLVFLHGGGFVRGDKSDAANIGIYFARKGIVAVTMNYRYAPEIQWPQGAEDIARALQWIRQNGGKFGGDVNRITLMGSSAGAAHVATYVFFEEFQLKEGDGVVGTVLFSGPTYDTSKLDERDFAYYGKDTSKHPAMSSIKNVGGRKIPVFIVIAELDMASIIYQNHALIDALYKRDQALPIISVLIGHNHISETTHFNTKDESIGPDILEFVKVTGKK
jgi:acetyl esterase/lipase